MNKAFKWAWRHYSLEVEQFDSLDKAVASAYFARQTGAEALESIEVPAEGEVYQPHQVWDLAEPLARAEEARQSAPRPPVVAEITITSPSGADASWDWYTDRAEAESEAEELRAFFGDRVQFRTVKPLQPEED